MTRIGAVFNPYHNAPEAFRPAVEAAEEAGLSELWLWEDCFRESAFGPAAAALAWTENLSIGIGISPMPMRNVALTAMEIATIDRMFPGRLYPGMGHGVLSWMAQVGARVNSPLTLMAEYITGLRALLAGEEVTANGRYVKLDQVRLDYPPQSPPPVYAGGEGPKTLALTGEVADGTILVAGYSPEHNAKQTQIVQDARSGTSRGGSNEIIAYVTAAFGDGAEDRVRVELGEPGVTGGSALWGDVDIVASGVRGFVEAGATAVILVPAGGEPDLPGFIGKVAQVARVAS